MSNPNPDILSITQFELLDSYKLKRIVRTPFGPHYISSVDRLSEHEFQVWLKPPFVDESVLYYLKLNKPGFLHVLYRWEETQ